MGKDKTETATEQKAPETKTPREWAIVFGKLRSGWIPSDRPGKTEFYAADHSSAAVLHGWAQHEHHEGKPIQLTREDYEAALRAAETAHEVLPGDPCPNAYRPHANALSPHKGRGVRK